MARRRGAVGIWQSIAKALFKAAKSSGSRSPAKKPVDPAESKALRKLESAMPFLEERWEAARALAESGDEKAFGVWYYEAATDRQLEKLASLGLNQVRPSNKGAASDVIGLFMAPDDGAETFLKFFGAWKPGMTETHAREAIRQVELSPGWAERWASRPPGVEESLFSQIYSYKFPKGCTLNQAQDAMRRLFNGEDDSVDVGEDEWGNVLMLWSEARSKDDVENYGIKRLSQKQFVTVIRALRSRGENLSDIMLDDVAAYALEHMPEVLLD